MMRKLITMSEEELFRHEIINKLTTKEIKAKEASELGLLALIPLNIAELTRKNADNIEIP